jgi:hypothetical protein
MIMSIESHWHLQRRKPRVAHQSDTGFHISLVLIRQVSCLFRRRRSNVRDNPPKPASTNVVGSGAGSGTATIPSASFNPETSEALTVAPAMVYSPI